MRSRGFTLIELLVVIVIIGILVAIALPNFIKVKDKAKEAEVKQNLHSIQLAVERYATDRDGNYPYFLYGGDSRYNLGTAAAVLRHNYWDYSGGQMKQPFDMFWLATDTWDYTDCTDYNQLSDPNLDQGFGDTVAFEGYMPKYPSNPFVEGKARIQFSTDYWNAGNMWVNATACWGGEDGVKMFNMEPWGDYPLYHKAWSNLVATKPLSDFPGQFQYHPRFTDMVSNWGHLNRQFNDTQNGNLYPYLSGDTPLLNDQGDMSSLDVAAYDLLAVGSVRTKGQDLDNAMPGQDTKNQNRYMQHRTGYLTLGQERNPWIRTGTYTNSKDYGERPYSDSVPDFFIIHLSSGIDKKIQDEMQKE